MTTDPPVEQCPPVITYNPVYQMTYIGARPEQGYVYHLATRPHDREAIDLLRELHEAMAVVMVFRRLSSSQAQSKKAEAAIAVWRKVEAFLVEGNHNAQDSSAS